MTKRVTLHLLIVLASSVSVCGVAELVAPEDRVMTGAHIDAVGLGMRNSSDRFKPEVWITAYPAPLSEQRLTLIEERRESQA